MLKNLFFKNKAKKFIKKLETVKNSNNVNNGKIKLFLKPTKQSIIIKEELETAGKLTFLILLFVEHPKTAPKISKAKIITQKLNKTKFYTESKATDCTLLVDIIKRYSLFKNFHNIMKLKDDESLDLTIYYIKRDYLK